MLEILSSNLGSVWIAVTSLAVVVASFIVSVRGQRAQRRLEQELKYESTRRVAAELANAAASGSPVDLAELKRAQETRESVEFEQNAVQGAFIDSISFNNAGLLSDSTWSLQPGLNVLLGRNGYGKSLLLRELAALLTRSDIQMLAKTPQSQVSVALRIGTQEQTIVRGKSGFEQSPGPVPVLAISDSRFVVRNDDALRPIRDPYASLARHGAYHFLHQLPSNTIVQGLLYSLCVDYMEAGRRFELPIFRMLNTVFKELTDDSFRFHSVTRPDPNGFNLNVKTEGNPDPVAIQAASQGTLSVLAVFGLIYRFMEQLPALQPSSEALPGDGRAIIIIDELDAHLHPSWQQRIAGLLRKTFPNAQFIISAHSPLLVAGCSQGEASVMKKDGSRFKIVNLTERDFIGAKADDIYKAVFDVDTGEDEVFTTYSKLAAQEKDNGPRIRALEAKTKPDAAEEQELQQLLQEERLMRRAQVVEQQRAEEAQRLVQLETECSMLRIRVRELKAQLESVRPVEAPAQAPNSVEAAVPPAAETSQRESAA